MNNVTGYLELNGDIVKISSMDELKEFVARLGSVFNEMSEKSFIDVCKQISDEDCKKDDCGFLYGTDGKRLVYAGFDSEEYKVLPSCRVIADNAFSWNYYYYKGRMVSDRYTHEKRIKKLSLPDSIIAIGSEAFYGNKSLRVLIPSNSLQFIGEKAFRDCFLLVDFTFPDSLKYIGSEAFMNCDKMEHIVLPNNLKSIGSHAFANCSRLQTIFLPASLEHIGSGIVDHCENLMEIRIPAGTKDKFAKLMPFSVDKFVEVAEEKL